MKQTKQAIARIALASLVCLTILSPFRVLSQQGIKWSVGGNNAGQNDFLGTVNNAGILFKTNNMERMLLDTGGNLGVGISSPLVKLHIGGHIRTTSLAGLQCGLVLFDNNGELLPMVFPNNPQLVLLGNGQFGDYSDNDWLVSGTGMSTMDGRMVGIGKTPEKPLDVEGAAAISGPLVLGDNMVFNGSEGTITLPAGNISFGNTGLETSGNIKAQNLTVTGSSVFGMFTVNELVVNQGLKLANNIEFTGLNNNIFATNTSLNLQCLPGYDRNVLMNSNNAGKVGIGTANPQYKLDVNGDARIDGYLYVTDGVIVGQEFSGGKVKVNLVKSNDLESHQINAVNMAVEESLSANDLNIVQDISSDRMFVNKDIKVQTLSIDGINSSITSSTGHINFGNANLATGGSFSTGSLTVQNLNFLGTELSLTNLAVAQRLTVGSGSLILGLNDLGTAENHIYADNSPLYLQTFNNPNNYPTIINGNSQGYVGIGTTEPVFQLHIKGITNIDDLGDNSGPIDIELQQPKKASTILRLEDQVVDGSGTEIRNIWWDMVASGNNEKFYIGKGGENLEYAFPFTITETQRVGIGTTEPTTRLDVNGNLRIRELPGTLANANYILVSTGQGFVGKMPLSATSPWVKSGANITYNGGWVGMGTEAPQKNLHVKGITCANCLEDEEADLRSAVVRVEDYVVDANGAFVRDVSWDFTVSGVQHKLYFENSTGTAENTTVMTLTEDGKVGIGTENPAAQLHTVGSLRFENLPDLEGDQMLVINSSGDVGLKDLTGIGWEANGANLFYNGGKVGIGTNSPTDMLHIEGTGDQAISIGSTVQDSYLRLMAVSSGNPGEQQSQIQYRNKLRFVDPLGYEGGIVRMTINAEGSVGIGTEVFETDAKLTVRGKIYAQEIEVVQDVNNIPDYVFDKDYRLMSLSELEYYILKAGHLPDVPSAEEMAQQGMNLGDMNILLLKKVEELTLYLIEQQKRIETLEREFEVR